MSEFSGQTALNAGNRGITKSERLSVEKPFLDQLATLGWTVTDQGVGVPSDPAGGLTLDSGVFNPELLGTLLGNKEWAKARLRDRMDAAIAHEHEEARWGGNHVEALKKAPDTELPISEGGRHILRAMPPKEERER